MVVPQAFSAQVILEMLAVYSSVIGLDFCSERNGAEYGTGKRARNVKSRGERSSDCHPDKNRSETRDSLVERRLSRSKRFRLGTPERPQIACDGARLSRTNWFPFRLISLAL